MQRTFHDSNQIDGKMNKILQNCVLEKSDTEHSDRKQHLDRDKEQEANRNYIGNFKDVRCQSKWKKLSNEILLHSELRWNDNMTFILVVHDFDALN
jgi:hypothetical protein